MKSTPYFNISTPPPKPTPSMSEYSTRLQLDMTGEKTQLWGADMTWSHSGVLVGW